MMVLTVILIMLVVVIASISLGWSLGSESAARKITGIDIEALKERAFQEAKKEYKEWFAKKFDGKAQDLENSFVRENKQLREMVEVLKEELAKERKKNEGTGSN